MSKTIIVLNPMGTDVTNFVNGTNTYQLLNNSILDIGDTVYKLPYTNTSGIANIQAAVPMLDAKLKATTGEILVFGYSEGCQIADWWLANQGATPATGVSPSDVTFLLVGNADRKYGGFVYGRPIFDNVAYTAGKPDNTPYTVVDFVRQYDPIGDFPTATPIVNALVGLQTVESNASAYSSTLTAIEQVMANTEYAVAVENAVSGLVLIHAGLAVPDTGYMSVTPNDDVNISLTDGNITWVWSPTYPVPLLGTGDAFTQSDEQKRTQIETAYTRPVQIPMPIYADAPAWGVAPFPAVRGLATVFTLADIFQANASYLTTALEGTVTTGNTVQPIAYPNWSIFEAQVATGAQMLDSALTAASGKMVVFGHGLGAVVASNWLKNYGPTSAVSATDLSFVLIGNPVRLYGGYLNADNISGVFPNSYPVPSGTPYTVRDFSRQYDGWSDYPQMVGSADDQTWAFLNALSGQGYVHPYYNGVSINDAANVWYTPSGSNISWGWSPTWPLPIYGSSQNSVTQLADNELRVTVEAAYNRPVTVNPDYTNSPFTQTLGPSGIASGAMFGAATVSIGQREILPDGIGTDGLFGETWVWHSGTITPKGIASSELFGKLTIPFPAVVLPTPIAKHGVLGTPTVTAA